MMNFPLFLYFNNLMDWATLAIASVILVFYLFVTGHTKKQVVLAVLLLFPFLFFSSSMATQAVTADEPQYISAFIDPANLKYIGKVAYKVLYEYKFSQLTIGSIFSLFRIIFSNYNISPALCEVTYKILHHSLMMMLIVFIVFVFKNNILKKNTFLGEIIIFLILIGFPLSCQMLKVANYDSFSTYLGILGLTIMWASYLKKSAKLAFFAVTVLSWCPMEKWTALPYWCLGVMLFNLVLIEKNQKKNTVNVIFGTLISYVYALFQSVLYFAYVLIYQRGLAVIPSLGLISFPYVHALRAMITGNLNIELYDSSIYTKDTAILVIILFVVIVFCSLFLIVLIDLINKKASVSMVFLKISCTVCLMLFAFGLYGAYKVTEYSLSSVDMMEIGAFVGNYFDGTFYHYGPGTPLTYLFRKMCYTCAIVIVSFPSMALIAIVLLSISLATKKSSFYENSCDLYPSILLGMGLLLLLIYSFAGLPSDARYYSLPIYLTLIVFVYFFVEKIEFKNYKKIYVSLLLIMHLFTIYEMVMFFPNIHVFLPLWVNRNEDFKITIREKETMAGEAMLWGEDLAIGGNIILHTINPNDSQVTIYSNYGSRWYKMDDSIEAVSLHLADKETLKFDDKTYYIMNKFMLFRNTIPNYIYEIEPYAVISYRGEIAAWIYRGDALTNYSQLIK